jgi:hypothetical protein
MTVQKDFKSPNVALASASAGGLTGEGFGGLAGLAKSSMVFWMDSQPEPKQMASDNKSNDHVFMV